MEVKILKQTKEELMVEVNNLTIVEVLRTYLNKQPDVKLAVWRREHPTENPILKVKTKGKAAGKAVKDAISEIEKETDKLLSGFKKAK